MRISVPTEVKNNEFRVAITAAGVHELVAHGHEVTVQAGAGEGSFITDAEYEAAGATIAPDAAATAQCLPPPSSPAPASPSSPAWRPPHLAPS